MWRSRSQKVPMFQNPKIHEVPRLQGCKVPRSNVQRFKGKKSKGPKVQRFKVPKYQSTKVPIIQRSKGPKVQNTKVPKYQDPKVPRSRDLNVPFLEMPLTSSCKWSFSGKVNSLGMTIPWDWAILGNSSDHSLGMTIPCETPFPGNEKQTTNLHWNAKKNYGGRCLLTNR